MTPEMTTRRIDGRSRTVRELLDGPKCTLDFFQPARSSTRRVLRAMMSGAIAVVAFMAAVGPAEASSKRWPSVSRPPDAVEQGNEDAAVIIAIEDYAYVPDVEGASKNGRDWHAYLVRGRGIPPSRVQMLLDEEAVDHRIRAAISRAATQVQPGGTLWIVFIGHGAPTSDGQDTLLIGADADRSVDGITHRSVTREELLAGAAEHPADTHSVVILDACFSGEALVPGLQPLIPDYASSPVPPGVTLLAASSSGQFAGQLPGTTRPAFSYLVLGALRGWADLDADGKVSTHEVIEYARGAMEATVTDRTQQPTLLGHNLVLAHGSERGPDIASLSMSDRRARSHLPVLAAAGTLVAVGAGAGVVGLARERNIDELQSPWGANGWYLAGYAASGAGVLLAGSQIFVATSGRTPLVGMGVRW